jgi:hypothetical protein
MRVKLFIFSGGAILLSLLVMSCNPSFDKFISRGLELYKSGKTKETLGLIERGLIETSSIKQFSASKLFISNNVVYEWDNKEIRILYPVEIELRIDYKSHDDQILFYFDFETQRLAYSNGTVIALLNSSGDIVHTADLSLVNGKRISSIILLKERLYYCHDGELYVYEFNTRENAVLIEGEKFLPPFKDLSYLVTFVANKDILGVTSGIAGTYNSSFIDRGSYSVLLKNLQVSSSRVFIDNDSVFYISGSSGAWFLERVNLSNKRNEKLHKFDDIVDLFFFIGGGLIFESREGLWIVDNIKRVAIRIPLTSRLIAVIMDGILVKAGNRYYLLDLRDFLKKIFHLSAIFPDIFKVDSDFFMKL